MSQQSNEPSPAIASLNSRIEIMENFYNEMSKNLTSILEITRQNHSNGLMCECRLENRSHEINTRSVLNDLWSRQKILEEKVAIELEILKNFNEETQKGFNRLSERIEILENCDRGNLDLINHCQRGIEKCFEHIEKLKEKFDTVCKNFDENRIIIQREPYKCPVCCGNGEVKLVSIEEVLANNHQIYKSCGACAGKGIVWG